MKNEFVYLVYQTGFCGGTKKVCVAKNFEAIKKVILKRCKCDAEKCTYSTNFQKITTEKLTNGEEFSIRGNCDYYEITPLPFEE